MSTGLPSGNITRDPVIQTTLFPCQGRDTASQILVAPTGASIDRKLRKQPENRPALAILESTQTIR